ncbi:matrixin family metalloprotease [Nocardioides sp.]|uniref:matrixin family metalloprotease n=1 Tax=Nocardioides sp. TaxID=35761 RepID=UPI0026035783|nr:matrixin family metalloprotease [Nocardioides sp.]
MGATPVRTTLALSLLAGVLLWAPHPAVAAAGSSDTTVPSTTLSVGVSGTRTVAANTPVTASGRVQAPAGGLLAQVGGIVLSLLQAVLQPLTGVGGAKVALELQTPTGWSTYSSATANAAGSYAVSVPTSAYGTHTWRISTAATATSAAAATAPFRVAVPTPYRPRGSARSYRLLPDGHARWNPCTPVPYYVNTAGMPRGAMTTVRQALAQVQAATGLTFRYAGRSRGVPFATGTNVAGMPSYGFTIAWASPKKVRQLRGSTVAISGSWSQIAQLSPTRYAQQYVAGGLVIDRTERLRTGMGRGRTLGFVLMHEMGHVVGLDHTRDTSQVMSAYLTSRSQTQYGAGDLAGFAAVGFGGGCL